MQVVCARYARVTMYRQECGGHVGEVKIKLFCGIWEWKKQCF